MYNITSQQIQELAQSEDMYSKLKTMFPHEFKPRPGWYVHADDTYLGWMVFYSEQITYGFGNVGRWVDMMAGMRDYIQKYCKLAPRDYVLKRLIEEARKRGFVDIDMEYSDTQILVDLQGMIIYEDGVWAAPVFKPVLNKWYWIRVENWNHDALVCYQGDDRSYGFSLSDKWTNQFSTGNTKPSEYLREATYEEVSDRLIREAQDRGFLTIGTEFESIISDKGLIRLIDRYRTNREEYNDLSLKLTTDEYELYYENGVSTHRGGCSNPRVYSKGQWCKVLNR